MKRKTKILVLLLACILLCLVTGSFLKRFLRAIPRERQVQLSTETVYYAPLETETQPETEPTVATTVPTTAPLPETTAAATETTAETVAETTQPTVPETTAAAVQAETVPETTEAAVPPTVPETTAPPAAAAPRGERKTYESVPNYYETDYPEIRFGSGSFADYGSGVTSVAMVATYLTGYDYRPDTLAKWFSDYVGNQLKLLEFMSESLKLPYEPAKNVRYALQALKEGKLVIALMGPKSVFTTGQHFIVLTGINEAGKVMVNDPNRNNYSAWNLKKSFEEGFREGDILAGYSGAWIYDPARMPEEPFLYQDPSENVECRYPDLDLTDQETELLAKLVFMEADGEPFEGQQAVAEVILNRVAAGNFPATVNGVIKAPGQFRADQLYKAKPTHVQYEAVRRAWKGPYVLDEDVVFFGAGAVNKNVWGKIGKYTFCKQYS